MRDEWILKICASGSYQVGKTSLIRRYAEDKFDANYLPTIGVDVTTKQITIDEQPVKLLLWDTAGQEVFGKIRPMYFEGAFGCIIVYDITRADTFEALDRWITDFKRVVGENTQIAIIGNKKDLEDDRMVSTQEGKEFAEQHNIPFYECSAKVGGEIIPQIYTDLVRKYFETLREESSEYGV